MNAPLVSWGARANAGERAVWALGFLIVGIVAVIAAPVVIGLIAANSADDVGMPAFAWVVAVVIVLGGLVCLIWGYQGVVRGRQAYWLVLDTFGIQMWTGRRRGAFTTIPWSAVDAAELQPESGAEVLWLRLRPRLDPAAVSDEMREIGRSQLAAGAPSDWDLGLRLDPTSGPGQGLLDAVRRSAVPGR